MKIMTQLNLKGHEKKALQELKEGLTEKFPEVKIILYGSKARGDSETFSDIDVLVLLDREVNNSLEDVEVWLKKAQEFLHKMNHYL